MNIDSFSNDEKLILAMILDEAERDTTLRREGYLRSADFESQIDVVAALTRKLKFINELQTQCMKMEATA